MQRRRRRMGIVPRPIGRQSAPITVCVSNPAAFLGMGSIIVLEFSEEDAALRAARKIARESGRCVTVRGADLVLIETIPAASTH